MRGWVKSVAVGGCLLTLLGVGAAWNLAQAAPERTEVSRASVSHVDLIAIPDGGLEQPIPRARSISVLGVPYRFFGPGASHVLVRILDGQRRELVRASLSLGRTDDGGPPRLFQSVSPWGEYTDLMRVHLPPAQADALVMVIEPVPGQQRPTLLGYQADLTGLPSLAGDPLHTLSLVIGRGPERASVTRVGLYLERITDASYGWASPAVLVLWLLLFVVVTAGAAIVAETRPGGTGPL